jgi:hypothetical protein
VAHFLRESNIAAATGPAAVARRRCRALPLPLPLPRAAAARCRRALPPRTGADSAADAAAARRPPHSGWITASQTESADASQQPQDGPSVGE